MAVALDYNGEIALISGGATGLGFAIARAFGLCGATIALNDLAEDRVAAACERLRTEAIACRGSAADVRDAEAVSTLISATEEELGAPSIVVANAGLYPNTPFLDLSETEWDRVIDTNLKGVFLLCQAAARSMVRAGVAGRIIVISSTAAQRAIGGWSHYCTSKAAAVMLTRAMALELGPHGIRVNTVLPGYIDVDEGGQHLSLAYREGARAAAPLGRAGTPEDVARGVLLLASPLADYISGAAVVIDGAASAGPVGLRVVDP
ncbi:MAG: SDR family oxidoreductase [Chloroflexi bacterium]|nr:SDR family oxidoreductase [Chloroflexota bacterium]